VWELFTEVEEELFASIAARNYPRFKIQPDGVRARKCNFQRCDEVRRFTKATMAIKSKE